MVDDLSWHVSPLEYCFMLSLVLIEFYFCWELHFTGRKIHHFCAESGGSFVSSRRSISSSLMKALSPVHQLSNTSPGYWDSMQLHSICKWPYSIFYPWLFCASQHALHQAAGGTDTIHPHIVSLLQDHFLPDEQITFSSIASFGDNPII